MGQTKSVVQYIGPITDAQLIQHNNKDSLWIRINDKIYDITKFQVNHPGGAEALLRVAGKDATQQFQSVGHSADILKRATEKYCIGTYKEGKKSDKTFLKVIEQKDKEIECLKAQLAAATKGQKVTGKTIYEQLGGKAAMDAFIPIFYKYVLSDDRVKHFFAKTDMTKLKQRQHCYLSSIFGCPEPYYGKDMATAHKGMNLNDTDFNVIIEIAAKVLTELGVSSEIIGQCAQVLEKDRAATLHK